MNHEELRRQLDALREEIRSLSDVAEPTDEQEQRLEAAIDEYAPLEERTLAAERRAAQVEQIRRDATTRTDPGHDAGAPGQIRRVDPFGEEIRTATRSQLRDRALAAVEQRGRSLNDRQRAGLDRLIRMSTGDTDGSVIAERLLLTENDAYRRAFAKGITLAAPAFTSEEAEALSAFRAFDARHALRAANEGVGSQGGYGIPVMIDPTIILTSGAADAPILDVSTVKTITTNQWKGVASAGFSWSYYPESGTVADNTVGDLTQPTIPVYSARGFLPYTLEVEQDYPGFEEEMRRLLAQGYVNLLAPKTMTGSGVNEPTGIFTRMASTAANPVHVVVTTAGVLGAVDVRKAWGALPERYRQQTNTRWVMSVSVQSVISAFGNNLALSDYTVNLAADGTSVLTGRPVILTDYAPQFTGQTGAFNYTVLGDFSNFYIVQRAGMSIELVPHLFDPATGRPTGQRGWFAWARHGFDVVNVNAFRLVANS